MQVPTKNVFKDCQCRFEVCVCGVRLWLINYTLVASSSRNVQAGTVQQTAVPSMSVINELFTFDLMNTLKLSMN